MRSSDEVMLVLERLHDERLRVMVWFVSPDMSVYAKVTGFVNGLEDELITFSDGKPSPSVVPQHRICVNPRSIVEPRYTELTDSKEIPERNEAELEAKYGNTALRLTLESGAELTVLAS